MIRTNIANFPELPTTALLGNGGLMNTSGPRNLMTWLHPLFASLLLASTAAAQLPVHPLEPPDRSSPRAALKTFLDTGDATGAFMVNDYLPSPSRAKFHQLVELGDATVRSLDLTEVPPAARQKTGRAAAMALYDTLSRIQFPAFEEIPDAPLAGTNAARWVIPKTEIALERIPTGTRSGEFLFSPDTVARAGEFYERVRGLPCTRAVPLENLREIATSGGGWMIPYRWVQAMPAWFRTPQAGQARWKWLALALILGFFAACLRVAYGLSRKGSPEHPFRQALAQLVLPAIVFLATPVFAYLALAQVNLIGDLGSALGLIATAVLFLAGAWIAWRAAPVMAEAIIASPSIAPESIDAHLIRIFTRLLGIIGVATLLAIGADRLGMPVYGIVASLGVGGLAIALAAQPTIENLIGGLSLFADKPIRVGDLAKYGDEVGTVETVGIRSTRIRGLDRTLTTIPNAVLAKMPIVNLARRDRMLLKCILGVRYETSPEQLRYLLVRIREMLLSHPRVHPDPTRVRFVGFGDSSLNIEVFAYGMTKDWTEFLGIQEDVFLRIMDIVKESGTGFAFPSQTLYYTRDDGLDTRQTESAEARVRQWREEGRLPFPDFPPDQAQRMRGTLVYPPPGSPGQPLRANDANDPGGMGEGPSTVTQQPDQGKEHLS